MRPLPGWLPVVVLLSTAAGTLLLWLALLGVQRQHAEQTVQATAEAVRNQFQAEMRARLQALSRIAHQWEGEGGSSRRAWETAAELTLRDYPGIQSVQWVDSTYSIRWIMPRTGFEAAQGLYVAAGPWRAAVLRGARERRVVAVAPPAELAVGGKGFVAFAPLFPQGRFGGFIAGVFRARESLRVLLGPEIAPGYGLSVSQGGEELYHRDVAGSPPPRLAARARVELGGTGWTVAVWPGPAVMRDTRSSLPAVVLGGGLFMALLLGAAAQLLRLARLNAGAAEAARAELGRERDFALQVMGTMGQGLAVTDADGRIEYANPAYGRMLGIDPAALTGRTPWEFTHPDDIEELRRARSTRIAGETSSHELRLLRPDGGVVHTLATGSPRAGGGGFGGAITVVSNVTRQREAERSLRESEERYRSLVEVASDIIYRADPQGRFVYVNPMAERTTGRTAAELVGLHFLELVRPDAREETEQFYQRQFRERLPSTYHEFPLLAGDGRELWIGQNVHILMDGAWVTGFQAVARDITARREVERLKDEFVSVAGHELRTPLTSIRGSLELLASGVLGPVPEKGAAILDIAVRNTERLVRLVNDLLDVERLASGKVMLDFCACSSDQLVRVALENVQGMAERAGVALADQAHPVRVQVDPERIVQVLVNLLANAVKYSPEHGEVAVRTVEGDGELRFEVRDEGRGIPADKLEHVFGRFQQVDRTDARVKGGSGLGLAIARSIVEQHGGRIGVESVYGKGSTFWFSVPIVA